MLKKHPNIISKKYNFFSTGNNQVLPTEIWSEIFSYLTIEDIGRVSLTSVAAYNTLNMVELGFFRPNNSAIPNYEIAELGSLNLHLNRHNKIKTRLPIVSREIKNNRLYMITLTSPLLFAIAIFMLKGINTIEWRDSYIATLCVLLPYLGLMGYVLEKMEKLDADLRYLRNEEHHLPKLQNFKLHRL